MSVQRRGIIEITNFGFVNPKKIPLNRLYKMGGHPHPVHKSSLSSLPLLVKKLAHKVFILFYKIQSQHTNLPLQSSTKLLLLLKCSANKSNCNGSNLKIIVEYTI